MQKFQKTYTQEFNREAVGLAQTGGKPIAQIARELGISDSSSHQWRKELAEHGTDAFAGSATRRSWRKKIADSNSRLSPRARNAIY